MKVIARQGHSCPREDWREAPIGDKSPVDVPETSYYRRRLADGSLIHAAHAAQGHLASAGKNKEGDKK